MRGGRENLQFSADMALAERDRSLPLLLVLPPPYVASWLNG